MSGPNVLQLIDRPREDEALIASFLLGRPGTTRRVYRNEVKLFQEFAPKPLRIMCADDLRAYIEKCRLSKLRPATLRHKVAVIKALFSFLYEEGNLQADPMRRVATPPHPQPDSSRCLDAKQVRAFFAQIPAHRTIGLRDQAIFVLASNCGLRLSELARLSISDAAEGSEKGWMRLLVHGKGGKDRIVDVRPEIWLIAQGYLRRRREELASCAPLFASLRRGSCIRPQAKDLRIPAATIYRRFKLYAKRAGLPEWSSPHCLRHFFASEAHKNGAPAEAIRKALGHASLAVTQRYLDGLATEVNEAFVAVKVV